MGELPDVRVTAWHQPFSISPMRRAPAFVVLATCFSSAVLADLCPAGAFDHDDDEATACGTCEAGAWCAGGVQDGEDLRIVPPDPASPTDPTMTPVTGSAAYGYPLNTKWSKSRFQSLFLRDDLLTAGFTQGDKL